MIGLGSTCRANRAAANSAALLRSYAGCPRLVCDTLQLNCTLNPARLSGDRDSPQFGRPQTRPRLRQCIEQPIALSPPHSKSCEEPETKNDLATRRVGEGKIERALQPGALAKPSRLAAITYILLVPRHAQKKAQQARGTCWARSDETEAVVARDVWWERFPGGLRLRHLDNQAESIRLRRWVRSILARGFNRSEDRKFRRRVSFFERA